MLLLGALAAADPQKRQQSKEQIGNTILSPSGLGAQNRINSIGTASILSPSGPGAQNRINSIGTAIADPRSPREIAASRDALLTNLVGDISNLPIVRDTPLGMAGGFMPLVSKILNPTPYVY
tara:strand:- start:47 stop:412 length:366 start_codon:yes stop_codon:yes gene_type:complete